MATNDAKRARPIEILLVEDNPGDVVLTREALADGKILNRLHVASDGAKALDFLHKRGEFAASPRPDLVLLDLNLPKVNGQEVLAAIKGDRQLRTIPVIVLTTSNAEADIVKSYDLHANCYIQKPVEFDAFIEVVRSLENFWLTVVKLPH